MNLLNDLNKTSHADQNKINQSINLNFLEATFSDDLSFIIPLLETVQTQSKHFIRHLSDQVLAKDFTAIAKAAHSMRSTGAYIGAHSLTTLISQLEESALASNYKKVKSIILEIQYEVTLITDDIDEYLIAKAAIKIR